MESMPAEAADQYHPMDDGLQITEIDACGDELILIAEDFARMDDGDLGGNVGQEAAGFSVPVPNINDLYLSFQGEVYVFHSVSPEKVQAVLLLLGGRQLPPGTPSISDPTRDEVTAGAPQSTAAYRLASLLRFRQKRKDRCFEKKIRYNVHKEVVQRMQRVKGHFASARPNAEEEIGSPALGSDSSIGATEPSCEEAICQHCNVTEKSTPQMRRGPGGSRTLCNACGLKWVMGKLNNVNVIPGQAPSSKFAA